MNIVFAGTSEFSKVILNTLIGSKHNIATIYTKPDKPSGRGRKILPSAVKKLALEHGIPLLQPRDLKNIQSEQQLQSLKIDLMIVAAYGLILPQKILNIPRLACINIHASLLPKWRGATPVQHAILAGDKISGITIIQMDAGLDTGNMLLSEQCSINNADTSYDLELQLRHIGSKLIIKFLNNVNLYLNNSIKQDNKQATYARKINKLETKINWNDSAINIDKKIRAFNSSTGCYFLLNSNIIRIKIWQATTTEHTHNTNVGTIIKVNKNFIDIAAGNKTILRLLQLQLPGSIPLHVKDILNSKSKLFVKNMILS